LFFSAARGQTAGPILTLNVSTHVFLKILYFFVGQNNNITISGESKSAKTAKKARIGIFQPICRNLTMAISPKQ